MNVDLARDTALKILYDINQKGAYSNISINKHLEGNSLKPLDRAFVTELVYGTEKWKLTIDRIISEYSSVKLKKLSPWIHNILRLGVYQLLFLDKVPEAAACNESVNLAKKYGHLASSKFVNGVLRSIARNREKVLAFKEEASISEYLSVKHSHPEWLVKLWLDRFGRDFTEALLASNNETPDLCVRVNTLKISKEALLNEIDRHGLQVLNGRYVDECIILKNSYSISDLEIFKRGYIQVQDESSMLVGRIANPKPGQLVVDVCSAPGGKATHMAQLMKNEGRIIARDIHEHKIKLVKEASERLGANIIDAQVFDATVLDGDLVGKADCVLVDAPCTGLGIIRRKPDIKWARKQEDIVKMAALQRIILDTASNYVKTGGTLIYSTCTISVEENEGIVVDFLNRNKKFSAVEIDNSIISAMDLKVAGKGYIQLFPNINHTDGFFISKMVRKE